MPKRVLGSKANIIFTFLLCPLLIFSLAVKYLVWPSYFLVSNILFSLCWIRLLRDSNFNPNPDLQTLLIFVSICDLISMYNNCLEFSNFFIFQAYSQYVWKLDFQSNSYQKGIIVDHNSLSTTADKDFSMM